MVVFGAGASTDSVPPEEQRGDPLWRPPLASDLFEGRPNFRAILAREGIREALPIAHEMRRLTSGETVEQRLEALVERSATYPALKRQLRATQLYLQQLLWDCSQSWIEAANYFTNYSELAGRLDRWSVEQGQQIVYVTFNYDTLLERAMPDPPTTVPQYLGEMTRIYKVHGSVNWGLRAKAPGGVITARDARPAIVRVGDTWEPTNDYQIVQNVNGVTSDGRALLPVIAIPTVTKSAFAMPPEHLEQMRRDLARVRGMLVVGWRANEAHFMKELADHLPQHVPVDVISPRDPRLTAARLSEASKRIRARPLTSSFTEYMNAPQHLDKLLEISLSPDRGANHW